MNHIQNFSCVIILIIWHSSCQVNSQPRFGIQVLQAPMSYIILSGTFQEVVHLGCRNFVIGPQSDLSSPKFNNGRKSREITTAPASIAIIIISKRTLTCPYRRGMPRPTSIGSASLPPQTSPRRCSQSWPWRLMTVQTSRPASGHSTPHQNRTSQRERMTGRKGP